jgi:arsenite methyltransferase
MENASCKDTSTHQDVKDYYGKILETSKDLQTNACCCSTECLTTDVKEALSQIDEEILDKFYGCGSPLPPVLKGCTVLDLGCGTGRDVYVASKLVGADGRVIGVDMTDEQLSVARKHIDDQTKKFGYASPNVEFKQGYIEDLQDLGIEDNSVDVVISNCVINLSPAKNKVFSEIFRVLKPGGELYFSDVFSDRRIPEALRRDPVLYGECLSGALYVEDFRRMLQQIGCSDMRVVSSSQLTIENPEIQKKLGEINFYSNTVRAFKIKSLEDRCEDYGQVATYLGTIPDHESGFMLDDHHYFEANRPMLVCGNTSSMLSETRYAKHFLVSGDRSRHFGLFPCGPEAKDVSRSGSCC